CAAPDPSRSAAPLPYADGAAAALAFRARGAGADARPSTCDVGTVGCLDGNRHCLLLHVRVPAQSAAQRHARTMRKTDGGHSVILFWRCGIGRYSRSRVFAREAQWTRMPVDLSP